MLGLELKQRHAAFTIVEMVVAMAMVVVMLGISAFVVRFSVQTYRTATAMACQAMESRRGNSRRVTF